MSAEQVWRAAHGLAKQKTIRMIWPELAAALDGNAAPAAAAGPGAPPPTPQPHCGQCRTRWARLTLADGRELCAYCLGLLPLNDPLRRRPTRHPEWPRIGDIDRDDER